MAKIVIISGNPFAQSRLNGVLQVIQDRLEQGGAEVSFLRVADLPPEDLIYAKFDSPAVVEANKLVEQADAVVVATPIYKASYTGVLKTFLDLLPQKALEGKTTLAVGIGGTISHLLVLDYVLKPVLAVLGAQNQLQGVYAVDSQVKRLEEGGYELEEELTARLQAAAEQLLHQ